MGLDIYLSKKTFIGAMFKSCGITGEIRLFKRGRKIPINLDRVSFVTEDIYHGRKHTGFITGWKSNCRRVLGTQKIRKSART